MRFFNIKYKTKGNELTKNITVSKPCGDIGRDAKIALGIFMNAFGNMRKNEVLEIQEVSAEGTSIGLPITPMAETNIMPTKRK